MITAMWWEWVGFWWSDDVTRRYTQHFSSTPNGNFSHSDHRCVIIVKITKHTTLLITQRRVGVVWTLPGEGVAEKVQCSCASRCENEVIVVRISAKVSQHHLPSVVYERGGQRAAWTLAVRVRVQVTGEVVNMRLQLLGGVQCGSCVV